MQCRQRLLTARQIRLVRQSILQHAHRRAGSFHGTAERIHSVSEVRQSRLCVRGIFVHHPLQQRIQRIPQGLGRPDHVRRRSPQLCHCVFYVFLNAFSVFQDIRQLFQRLVQILRQFRQFVGGCCQIVQGRCHLVQGIGDAGA